MLGDHARQYLETQLIKADSRLMQDRLLDIWLDHRDRATEGDAFLWGFPDDWMKKERILMEEADRHARKRRWGWVT